MLDNFLKMKLIEVLEMKHLEEAIQIDDLKYWKYHKLVILWNNALY